jgi:hypothetical protein
MTTTATITPIPVKNGITHTGDNVDHLEAAATICTEMILEDPEWVADVVVAALIAQHELRRGLKPSYALRTLTEALNP